MNAARDAEMHALLGAFALGAVDADEAAAVRAYLATNAEARAELAELMAGVEALALAAEPIDPPAALRGRLAAATLAGAPATPAAPALASAEPAPPAPPVPIRRSAPVWSLATPWAAAAAALLLIVAGLLLWNVQLRDRLATTPPPEVVALTGTDAAPNAKGEVRYLPGEQIFTIDVRDLPPLPEGKVYEVWLIGAEGPVPAGVFDQPAARHAVVADRSKYDTLAITAEPGPLGSEAPTGEIVATAPI